MSHVNMVPSDVRLLKDGGVVLGMVFGGVNCSIVKPVSDGTTEGINKPRFCMYLLEPGADGIDIVSSEFQLGGMVTEYHMVSSFLFSTQAA